MRSWLLSFQSFPSPLSANIIVDHYMIWRLVSMFDHDSYRYEVIPQIITSIRGFFFFFDFIHVFINEVVTYYCNSRLRIYEQIKVSYNLFLMCSSTRSQFTRLGEQPRGLLRSSVFPFLRILRFSFQTLSMFETKNEGFGEKGKRKKFTTHRFNQITHRLIIDKTHR